MNETLAKLGKIGLIPVIKLDSPAEALPLGKALVAGGLPVAEVTFRTEAAEESIRILANELPELVLGAGTVLTTTQAEAAAAAGARYIVTPGFNPKIVSYCIENGIPVTPGVSSPSQIEQAIEMGLHVAKFFPAEPSGGVDMLKSFAGPYGDKISFIPTGGIGPKNLADYLSCPNVFAVGGSWMVPSDAVKAGDFARIEKLCREARMLSLGFSLLHIGVNPEAGCDSAAEAKLLSSMLGMQLKEGANSDFVGISFEFMKSAGRGAKGHIAIETLSVERALEWFAGFGVKPVAETIKMKGNHISVAYLDKEICGFAVHLNRR
ncbi:bifunctional 4-hydroxy-2-oxoglutarate aldolase/2-dehydro-3-deoxy-phosphogluconate aldolase [Cloacibacillus evryensis]|uniref:2-dehydro-3-deoxy-phosphogluconate aldolase n=1 Tax=Cloacibacillus evryensis TaxID=508460 RepID=A0AAW5JXU8_9BACT|nr:bifunctional 4-hydroxy-2-oxoglutarate aldolase/2-dehydro-3-deoxy-phosphogluconate aldolase [Cloacibacillus evryensis]EHL70796.1 2-dehydro-3-deoxyphosphogluconate aldolase/4-hydroxy-2-oxoglutarate aldolase [Synergistes sp. 3_1_syn1]MCQ4813206.1 bifunctional 4-hydroxy-2-oxoglutarate aldolase/2-dehydro-3-deoxy-phosphogluconate aldolase [Cloacibacillus evryensis]